METGSLVLLPPRISTFSKVGAHCRSNPWAGGRGDERREERKKIKTAVQGERRGGARSGREGRRAEAGGEHRKGSLPYAVVTQSPH